MTGKSKVRTVSALVREPRTFVARLILADVVSKRGEGPLEPKRLVYRPRKR